MKRDLDAATLRELLDYDPGTGVFRWRGDRPGGKAKSGAVAGFDNGDGHLRIGICGHMVLAHRLAWLYVHGTWPKNEIDHISGVRDDNRISNLRDVSRTENNRNAQTPSHNTSGVTGVSWNNLEKKFFSYIKVNGKQKHLGRFNTLEAAAAARKDAERKYGYHPNHGRSRPQ